MKKIYIISSLLYMPILSFTQLEPNSNIEAYFSAMIVSDLDTSIDWYSSNLGFELINKVESKERGFKQSNLKRGIILIELIELDHAIQLKDIVPDYNSKTRTLGFFKIGFLVTDFDYWIDHLTTRNVDFYGNIVMDDHTGKRMMIINDPDGNRIQIFEK